MGFIQRVNELVLNRIRERSGDIQLSEVKMAGLLLHATQANGKRVTLDLRQLRRASAFRSSMPSGVEIGLLMEFEGLDGLLQISERCEGWLQACNALNAIDGAAPYPAWYFAFLADNTADSLRVYPGEA